VSDLFCRHNRFTADCPICSKGTLLESDTTRPTPRASTPSSRRSGGKPASRAGAQFRGPYATAGPYDRDGERVEVRLEKVPGGLRLAEWSNGALRRAAPVLPAADLGGLLTQARERQILPERELESLETAAAEEATGDRAEWGSSAGRTGDLREELRVEAVDDGAVRIGRWIFRPGADWELQEAPPMLPASRFAEAIAAARRAGAA
jgi:hypothetical protein